MAFTTRRSSIGPSGGTARRAAILLLLEFALTTLASACAMGGSEPPPIPPTMRRRADAGLGDAPPPSDAVAPPADDASSPAADTATPAVDAGTPPADPARFAPVVAALEQSLRTSHTPGAAVAIMIGGRVVFTAARGVRSAGGTDAVTPDTLFRVGSLAKPMTSAMVQTLVDDGMLDLRAPIRRYVPYFGVRAPGNPDTVTMHAVLSHTAGYPNGFPMGLSSTCVPYGAAGLVASFRGLTDAPLWYPPGAAWQYSNTGYALAGLVAQEAGRQPYVDLMRTRVFERAEMSGATFDGVRAAAADHAVGHALDASGAVTERFGPEQPDCAFAHPMSTTLFASATDLARFGAWIARGAGSPGGAALARMSAPYAETTESMGGYGYGWFIEPWDDTGAAITHGGSVAGFGAFLWLHPARQFGVAVVGNSDAFDPSEAAQAAIQSFLAAPTVRPASLDPRPMTEWSVYAGQYRDPVGDLGNVTVDVSGTTLMLTIARTGERVELRPWGRDRFTFSASATEGHETTALFFVDSSGRTTWLTTRWGAASRVM